MKNNLTVTILLVEDEEILRIMLQNILEHSGYFVLSAGSVSEAMEVFRQNSEKIDLLISDIILPDGRGHILAEDLDSVKPELPIILMSGYAEPDVLQHLKLKVTYIPKPFHANQLIEAIERLIGNTSPSTQ